MALRLRRGTDAQRQLITPAEGELIYATDTKRLWIGDGVTAGGILANTGGVYELNDLVDVDLTVPPESGDVLKFDGTKFIASPEAPFSPGGNYYINIVKGNDEIFLNTDEGYFTGTIRSFDGQVVILDSFNQTVYADVFGNLTGDVSGTVYGAVIGDVNGNVKTLDGSTVVVDTFNQVVFADLVGDVNGTVNGDVYGTLYGTLEGVVNGNVNGTLNGIVRGELIGSVYSDDSVPIIDATSGKAPLLLCDVANGTVTTETANVTEVIINQLPMEDPARNPGIMLYSKSDGMFDGPFIQTVGYRGSAGIGQQPAQVGDTIGQIRFSSANFGFNQNRAIPVVLNTVLTEVGDNVTTFTQGKMQVILLAGPNPANATITEISKGGILSTPVLKTGVYADATARDAHFTDRSLTPEAGMIIFLTSTGKFQGFDGTVWADLN